jgi:fatty acid desaturase
MLTESTRSTAIQVSFAGIALVAAAVVAFGPAITLATTVMLFTAILVSPLLLLVPWKDHGWMPAVNAQHGAERTRTNGGIPSAGPA